jgi:hypothetical protein
VTLDQGLGIGLILYTLVGLPEPTFAMCSNQAKKPVPLHLQLSEVPGLHAGRCLLQK